MGCEDFKSPLILTTPNTRGQRVKNAQWLLAGHNAWADNKSPVHTYYGRVDGVYGVETGGATRRAKYWLGYPDEDINTGFGELLCNLLKGDSKLSSEYADRRAERIANNQNPVKLKALKLAESEVGTKENPFGSNMQEYGKWYGMNGVPWCAIFCSWCISHSRTQEWKYSFVPFIVADAARGLNGMSITLHPEPGDLVAYTFSGQVNCHVAFFHSWVNDGHYNFFDLGGNTGPIDFSNGGQVMKQVRNVTMVSRFIRLTL